MRSQFQDMRITFLLETLKIDQCNKILIFVGYKFKLYALAHINNIQKLN